MPAKISPNSQKILETRYLDPSDGSVDGLWDRVSMGNTVWRRLLSELLFLPNSPTLFNLGLKHGGTLSACFVFDVDDSLLGDWPDGGKPEPFVDSILGTNFKAACVAKAGGGVGYYFGKIRPKGSEVKSTHKKACGPVTVLKYFHFLRSLITQGGKRDLAQMGVLDAHHPDIREFIHCKDDDPQGLSSFNLSVSWRNKLLEQVQWDRLAYIEHDLKNPELNEWTRLWWEQCGSAWKTGCPGNLFWDTINAFNATPHLGDINATNPCVTGDTLILTSEGWMPIGEMAEEGREVKVWNGMQWSNTTPRVTGHNQQIFRVTLDDGHYLDCTGGHRFVLADGDRVPCSSLKSGDVLEKYINGKRFEGEGGETKTAYAAGFYCGDGWWCEEKKQHQITFYSKEKIQIGRQLESEGVVKLIGQWDWKHDRIRGRLVDGVPHKTHVPLNASVEYRLGWLAGLLDSDGCVVYSDKSRRSFGYQITSVEQDFLRRTSLMLRGLGVSSKVIQGKEGGPRAFSDGQVYDCKTYYVLQIPAMSARTLQAMGLKPRRLPFEDNNPDRDATRFVKVVSVEPIGVADKVYCFTEPFRNRGVFNGVLTGNCGETPNISDEPCNLGSLAVCRYLEGTGKHAKFDWRAFEQDIRDAIDFMDAILDANKFPHPAITKMSLDTRKLGLGVMGWADLLAMRHIPYDSQEAVDFGGALMEFVNTTALDQSMILAAEKGPYPAWETAPEHVKKRFPKARNSTRTSIAPTGTIAIIADVWGSIEPHFALECTRTTGEGIVMSDGVPLWVKDRLNGFADFKPKVASEVHWTWHIKHQAAFQNHTNLGVSKTINLPNDATVKDVSDAYRMMWQSGCKGGTIFRDGCRNEQVLVKKEPTKSVYTVAKPPEPATLPKSAWQEMPEFITKEHVLKTADVDLDKFREYQNGLMRFVTLQGGTPHPVRIKLPDELPTVRKKFKIGGVKGYIHVGLVDGRPAEIFIRSAQQGSTVGGMLDAWCMGVSLCLQSGTALEDIVKLHRNQRFEPNGPTGDRQIPMCSSIPDYVVQWLALRFLAAPSGAGTNEAGTAVDPPVLPADYIPCPNCGNRLFKEAGCMVCRSVGCGFSKC